LTTLDGRARLYTPAMDGAGERSGSISPPANWAMRERAVDAYAAKRRETDPDLWIVEIEDKQGRHFLTERVEGVA